MVKLSEQFKEVMEKYGEDLSVDDIVNIDDLIDDLPRLMKEIGKQPAYVAYALEMKRMVNSTVTKYEKFLDRMRGRKRTVAIEHLKFDKNVHVTTKMIESKIEELLEKDENYTKNKIRYEDHVNRLSYIDMLLEVLRVREQTFKSLTYLMDSAMKTGLMYPNKRSS